LALGVLGLLVNYWICLDDFVLSDHYFLAKVTPAALVVELMHDLVVTDGWLVGKNLIDDTSQLHCLLKCNN
jgi:hypothetical protein